LKPLACRSHITELQFVNPELTTVIGDDRGIIKGEGNTRLLFPGVLPTTVPPAAAGKAIGIRTEIPMITKVTLHCPAAIAFILRTVKSYSFKA
jgi:hypothetical protein